MDKIEKIYFDFMKKYGRQGWWPLLDLHGNVGTNPTKSGSVNGYHPGDYSYPKNDKQKFEICIGAILTQNTAWPNVEKALLNLEKSHLLNPAKIVDIKMEVLAEKIRPSGYFNQKSKKIKSFSEFYIGLNGKIPSRDELLGIWGIGPETADSILLYAFKEPTFVVDTYTRRIFKEMRVIETDDYDSIKILFEKNIPRDFKIYQEYHALIVEHAKHK